MSKGRVYLWTDGSDRGLYGHLTGSVESINHLEVSGGDTSGLSGRFVCVRNGGGVYELDPVTKSERAVPLGDARPDATGDFLFEPGRGGGRIDKARIAAPDFRWRYIQASRFDGVRGPNHWLPFQGGHYRLPSRRYEMPEHHPISPAGEIHLGPGRGLLEHGALVEAAGGRYRANASHNAGIIYHEYGHHITRHTADFRANNLVPRDQQNNRKTAMDEGTCDYWAAAMLGTPHIWILHRRHDDQEIHVRSLASSKSMADFDVGPQADAHANGTIWGSDWDSQSSH